MSAAVTVTLITVGVFGIALLLYISIRVGLAIKRRELPMTSYNILGKPGKLSGENDPPPDTKSDPSSSPR